MEDSPFSLSNLKVCQTNSIVSVLSDVTIIYKLQLNMGCRSKDLWKVGTLSYVTILL